jgi:precorrin-6A/cobalt-precorrin-6A reductase
MNILILGGTSEASELIKLLALCPEIKATLSLAGRTSSPVLPKNNNLTIRIGGFGGALGLAEYIKNNQINVLICATHPFAKNMPWNALEATKIAGIPVLYVLRPAWQAQNDDKWVEVANHKAAIQQLTTNSQEHNFSPNKERTYKIFLTVGRLELAEYEAAAEHFYVVRSIDEVEEKTLRNAQYITARPPFTVADERELMRSFAIDFVITKNSGGAATEAKLTAARELKIPVILISRPPRPNVLHLQTAAQAMEWLKTIRHC